MVSGPEASWLPVLVFPAGHVVHTWFITFALGPQVVACVAMDSLSICVPCPPHPHTKQTKTIPFHLTSTTNAIRALGPWGIDAKRKRILVVQFPAPGTHCSPSYSSFTVFFLYPKCLSTFIFALFQKQIKHWDRKNRNLQKQWCRNRPTTFVFESLGV